MTILIPVLFLFLVLVLSGHGSDVLVLRGEQFGDRTNKL